jgi:guanidinopropionase
VNRYLEDRVYSQERLRYPLRRVGEKGNDRFERVSWDEALAGVAAQLERVIEEHGPTAILPYSYMGTQGMIQAASLDRRFFAHLGATRIVRNICGSAGGAGLTTTIGTNTGILPEDIVHSRFIILWGTNTVVTNLHLWPFVNQAKKRGAKVVVIDPVKTRTAAQADWHIRPLPGTDPALVLGMMHIIVKEGLYDEEYVDRYTLGFDQLRERIAAFPPERTAEITGLSAREIVEFARAYATTKPAAIRTLVGIEYHANGAMILRTIACLPALVGAWRDRGGSPFSYSFGLILKENQHRIMEYSWREVAVENKINPNPSSAPRYTGPVTFMRTSMVRDPSEVDIALIGVPFDGGVENRPGQRHGPREIRNMSSFMRSIHHVTRVDPYKLCRVADMGDVTITNPFNIQTSHTDITEFYRKIHAAGALPLSAGGDHSISLPILRGIAADGPVGMVHIDAHTDTADQELGSKLSHGTPFRRAVEEGILDPKRTVQIGIRGAQNSEEGWTFSIESGMRVIFIEEFVKLGVDAVIAEARSVVGDGPTYISFDVDSLDPAYAPGTGTPEVGGMSPIQAQTLIRGLDGLDLIGGDVVEVSPPFDPSGNTALVGATMMYEILCVLAAAVARRKGSPDSNVKKSLSV